MIWYCNYSIKLQEIFSVFVAVNTRTCTDDIATVMARGRQSSCCLLAVVIIISFQHVQISHNRRLRLELMWSVTAKQHTCVDSGVFGCLLSFNLCIFCLLICLLCYIFQNIQHEWHCIA